MTHDGSLRSVHTWRWLSRLGWGSLGLLLLLLLGSAWQGPDIFYHLYLGGRVLATGSFQPADSLIVQQPGYVNIYWLFQVMARALFGMGGEIAITLFMAVLWCAALAAWARTARLVARPSLGMPIALAAILIVQGRFDPRPEVVSYLCLSLQVMWLTTWSPEEGLSWRRMALFTGIQILWTNTHGYFVLGPLLVAARLLSAFHSGERRAIRSLAILLGLTIVGSLASPFGPKGIGFVLTLARFLSTMREAIVEFRPPVGIFLRLWTVILFWLAWIAVAVTGVLLVVRRRTTAFAVLLGLAALYLGAIGVRNAPLFVFLSAPLLRALLAEVVGREPRARRVRPAVAAVTAAVGILLSVSVLTGAFYKSLHSRTRFGLSLLPEAYPARVTGYLLNSGFNGSIFNNSADGGYLEYAIPGIRPYIDPRYIESKPIREYFSALRDPRAFAELDRRHRFDAVLLQITESSELAASCMKSPAWRLVYADPHRVLFARRGSAAGDRMPEKPARYYMGDDLSRLLNGGAAIGWVTLLARLGDSARLTDALTQLERADRIPAPVIQYALGYGMQTRNSAVVDAARQLHPKMLALNDQERAAVDQLMRASSAVPR